MQKKIYILLCMIWLGLQSNFAQSNTFVRLEKRPGVNFGFSLSPDNSGGFVSTGQDDGDPTSGSCDLYILKVDECANKIWHKKYGSAADEGGKYIIQTQDGGYCVVGCSESFSGFWVLKVNNSGGVVWSKIIQTATSPAYHVSETSTGDILVSGTANVQDGSVFKFDANGNLIWQKTIHGPGVMQYYLVNHILELPSGEMYCIGGADTVGAGTQGDLFIGKLDAMGNPLWLQAVNLSGTEGFDCSVSGCLVPGTSDVIVAAKTDLGSYLIRFHPNGSYQWARSVGGSAGGEHFKGITISGKDVFAVGATWFGQGERDVLLCKFDTAGNYIFSRAYGDVGADVGFGVQQTSGNHLLLSAFSTSFGADTYDPLFIRTDSMGFVENCDVDSIISPVITNEVLNLYNIPLSYVQTSALTIVDFVPIVLDVPSITYFECNNVPPGNVLATPEDTTLCVGDSIQFFASGAATYSWIGPAGFTSTQQNPAFLLTSANQGGVYLVTDPVSCGRDSVQLMVGADTVYVVADDTLCIGDSLHLSVVGSVDCAWTGPNGFSTGIDSPVLFISSGNQTGYYVVTTLATNCSASDSAYVTIIASANLPTSFDSICINNTLYLNPGGTTGFWIGPNGFSSSNPAPSIYISDSTQQGYYIIYDTLNCNTVDSIFIDVIDCNSYLIPPNVFTPNDDGTNDIYLMDYSNIIEFKAYIYDRWGLELFSWDDVTKGWNGKNSGGNLSTDGVYYYIIYAKGLDQQNYTLKGFLHLFRNN